MEEYNKIIESLNVKFMAAKYIKIKEAVTLSDFYDVRNTLLFLNKGAICFGPEGRVLREGEALFIPSGRHMKISYGTEVHLEEERAKKVEDLDKYFSTIDVNVQSDENFSMITFDTKVFDSVNFFQSLDIPAFTISRNRRIFRIIQNIVTEANEEKVGRERIIKLQTERLVVESMRYILDKKLFVEQLATNMTYFKDPRLLDIFGYIRNSLDGDLSNKALADVANVSEDYVGQYFKMLTGINPQDYIEYQRMEKAVELLRTSKRSIREIGQQVGYKDTAYFCRRFKMMFGISAGRMRRRESLISI